jgi:malate dehydrogenase (oxaloacetate-decarboxylating)
MVYQASPSYSLTIRARIERIPGALAKCAVTIGEQEGLVGAIPVVKVSKDHAVRDFDIYARDEAHERRIVEALRLLPGVEVISVTNRTFAYHEGGKIEVVSRRRLAGRENLSMAYTPGVGRVALAVADNVPNAYQYTMKGNSVAIVTDGTAVLGLGDIGPLGAVPVMEGKAVLFKEFAGINAFPICLNTKDPDSIVSIVKAISPCFAGINLEDISAPRCFDIEQRLAEELEIPVFHDDQHGTAIAVLAALKNALSLTGKNIGDARIVLSGTGAAGVACAKLLMEAGARRMICCDRVGVIYPGRPDGMNPVKEKLAVLTSPSEKDISLKTALKGADVFIGVSAGNLLKPSDLKVMSQDPIVFALANPVPEVDPWEAMDYAPIVATGRSDFPNQINNALVFPGLFRGVIDVRAKKINREMMMAAARAIAHLVGEEELAYQNIVPGIFDPAVCPAVSKAVAEAAVRSGVA